MKRDLDIIKVKLQDRSYNIFIGTGLLSYSGELVSQELKSNGGRVVVITNKKVRGLYGKQLEESLKKNKFKPYFIEMGDGERFKNLNTVKKKYYELIELKVDRSTPLIAFGGGVTGDTAGFIAATYMRGIPLIQIPTTLLAQVDSSVGGKTGVNLSAGKNLVGSFYQPKTVIIDTAVLLTLKRKEFLNGISEIIKYGVISSKKLFTILLQKSGEILQCNHKLLREIIKISCSIKSDIVEKDENESGIRAFLNFGHTIGHSIEKTAGYGKYKHGEAVALGMIAAVKIAVELKLLKGKGSVEIEKLIDKYNLPVKLKYGTVNKIYNGLFTDKKKIQGRLRFVLPERIGKVRIVEKVPVSIIKKSIKILFNKK